MIAQGHSIIMPPSAGQFIIRALRFAHRRALRMCLNPMIWRQTGGRVAGGPFVGMRCIRSSIGSEWPPKLLGTYELELAEIIEEVVRRDYDCIVNIGAGEGYYAVGLALRIPQAQVICFELDPRGRRLIHALAGLNGVLERADVRGRCTIESLRWAIPSSGRTLIVCDAEGDEFTLLRPEMLEKLCRVDVLVELHDFVHEGIGQIMRTIFATSHQIREISSRPRTVANYPETVCITSKYIPLLLSEERPVGMAWLWMTARCRSFCAPSGG